MEPEVLLLGIELGCWDYRIGVAEKRVLVEKLVALWKVRGEMDGVGKVSEYLSDGRFRQSVLRYQSHRLSTKEPQASPSQYNWT